MDYPRTYSSSRLSFLKCEEGLSGGIQTPLSVTVNADLSWEATVLGYKLLPNSDVFSALPPVIRAVPDIEAVLKYINSCSICAGNDDKRFKPLVSYREGKFIDSNGKLRCIKNHCYDISRREESSLL